MNKTLRLLQIGLLAGVSSMAGAATLQGVSGFTNPGALTMQKYVPDGIAANAPLVVTLHGCQQNGTEYYDATGWKKLSDRYKFALLVPTQTTANNGNKCFNWFDPNDFGRGKGESASIVNAMDKVIADHGLDRNRVFVTGVSAGGAMTLALLANYPDRFKSGAPHAGVAYGCANSTMSGITCMNTPGTRTGSEVKNAYPGYTGAYPTVLVFHGTSDQYVSYNHVQQNVNQWAEVHGIDKTADYSATMGVTTIKYYNNASGVTKVASYSISGMKHAVGVNPGSLDEECGNTVTEYYSDQNVCTSFVAGKFWGIIDSADDGYAGGGGGTTTTTTSTSSTSTTTSTTTTTTIAGACYTASNYAHTTAGRAYQSLGYTYANGSNQNMGLWNMITTTKLRQTGTNYYVIDNTCP